MQVSTMSWLLKLEQLAFFVFSIFLFSRLDYAWWWFPLLILTPDLSMLGYAAGPRAGALTYNFVHHKAVGLSLYLLGAWLSMPVFQLTGVILFGHSSMDRIFGYGLKYPDAFQHTHLGWIGGAKKE
jgi:hypothetical protein